MTRTAPLPAALAELPVSIIGAGPIGLAAAAQLHERGIEAIVLEAGDSAGAAVQQWAHARMFSSWEHLVDPAAARLLDAAGWDAPAAARLPTGRELVDAYLAPLAATAELAPSIHYRSAVIAVTRERADRTRTARRDRTPFVLRVQTETGVEERRARAVIDASGTWGTPNPLGSNGLDPLGIETVAENLHGALPDVLGADRARFAGRRTLVVGAGHSAASTLIALATLARETGAGSVTWAIRGSRPTRVSGAADDELAERGQLGSRVHELVRSGAITLVDRFEIDRLARAADGAVEVSGVQRRERARLDADEVVVATGFRPELGMLRELRLDLDEIVEAPRALAPLIDPNLHSCGTVYPHGVAELAHPEQDFYIAGMKSYGRAPTFLLLTGYEQVRSIADELAGDAAAARHVELVLPETGVCSTDIGSASTSGGCCAVEPAAGIPAEAVAAADGRSLLPLAGR